MKTTDIQDVKRSLVPLTLILCVGQDPALLKTRNLLLRAQGYIVESELSVNQAITHFRASDFDLVLLCHSLPAKDRDRLTCLIRASGSRIPVVSISSSVSHDLAEASIGCGPEELLKGVKEVLAKAAQTPAVTTVISGPKQELEKSRTGLSNPPSIVRSNQFTTAKCPKERRRRV